MADEPPSHEPELQHFGKYLLDQELARGGMSRVFRARLRGPGGFEKRLVVKQVLPELARDPGFIELFVKEANTLVQMSHPNLVPVYELGVIDGVYFLAMEWVEGATVAELLDAGALAPALVAQLGQQIAEALRYAHERFSIVHRDVTPRNVIVDEAGHARLLDFGIAAPIGHEGRGELFGSPGYIAPEQLQGTPLGPESDLFSLGAVLYEALCAQPAFPEAQKQAGQLAAYRAPAAISGSEPVIAELAQRLISLDRAARPGSAAEVAGALRSWLAERHPQGVERELAERVRDALRARGSRPTSQPSSAAAVSSGRIEVRSLAVSPALQEMLQQATVRIERESPAPVEPERERPDTLDDPEGHRVIRRFMRDIFVISVALMIAVWLANRAEPSVNRYVPLPEDGRPQRPPPSAAAAKRPVQPEPAPVVPPEPVKDPTPTAPEAPKSAYVTISAAPWANIQLDGRDAGTTPKRKLPVRPGKHTLLLSCPPLGKEARVALDLSGDQAVQVVVDLNETPARVEVR
ncbi:MAG TPA: serine/threonine-protein kinase [Polyangiales bacterium]|nr:serine/threonine-protein kinase [Polyangiales bacterium]